MVYIDPDLCIDCGGCEPECPYEAIFEVEEVPIEWFDYIEINAEMVSQCPEINEKKKPLHYANGEPNLI